MVTKLSNYAKEYGEELKELYDKDFPLWAEINLELLKEKAYDLVDWGNLLEEIEDMANRHLDACINQLARILEHIYKLDNFKNLAGDAIKSCIRSIREARNEIEAMFKEYPSLKNKLPLEVERSWIRAQARLKKWLLKNDYEPGDFEIPEKCPYTYEQAMSRDLRKEFKHSSGPQL